jgi:hypothetical protein
LVDINLHWKINLIETKFLCIKGNCKIKKYNHKTNENKKKKKKFKRIKMKVVAILLISLGLALAVDIPVKGGKS